MNKLSTLIVTLFLVYGCVSSTKVDYYQPEVVYLGKCVNASMGKKNLTKKCKGKFSHSVASDGVNIFRFFFADMQIQIFGHHDYTVEKNISAQASANSSKKTEGKETGNLKSEPVVKLYEIFKSVKVTREKADYSYGLGKCSWHQSRDKQTLACKAMLAEEQEFRIEYIITGIQE